ncbi:transmembrane proteins 14C-domain-containing protein [Coniella lustricola]|uniref:Transmembrane proteins 14C-domain-containing protein n=1 Tax=Coniella lustricola TaxID=2025994 RepID=A0A2T3AN13_9PEZI|nr:transmembrane proteins 14C-domain-containing protein [Coniella lustricola]
MGADHPAFTLAGLLAAGGTMGFVKGGSRPSLIAGVGLGASYGVAGYLLRNNKDYGSELALGNSLVLVGAATSRCIKTNWKAPVPLGLFATGSLATYYFLKKFKELNYGV